MPQDSPDHNVEACIAASPVSAVNAALQRQETIKRLIIMSTGGTDGRKRVLPKTMYPSPLSHQDYYMRKWGAAEEDCGYGSFLNPFNDARLPNSHWVLDMERRRAMIEAAKLKD